MQPQRRAVAAVAAVGAGAARTTTRWHQAVVGVRHLGAKRSVGPRNSKNYDWYFNALRDKELVKEPPTLKQLVPLPLVGAGVPQRTKVELVFGGGSSNSTEAAAAASGASAGAGAAGGGAVGGVVGITLLNDYVPATCERFLTLAQAPRGGYAATNVAKIAKGQAVMLGDVHPKDLAELGLFAIKDETYVMSHGAPGVVSLFSPRRDTGCARFFITLGPMTHLDGRCVPFGFVHAGMDVLAKMGDVLTFMQKPLSPIVLQRVVVVGAGGSLAKSGGEHAATVRA